MEDDTDTGFIALSALRYAMGRRTYACSLVADWVKRHWSALPDIYRPLLLRDLKEFLLGPPELIGAKCDWDTWRELLSWMEDKLDPAEGTSHA